MCSHISPMRQHLVRPLLGCLSVSMLEASFFQAISHGMSRLCFLLLAAGLMAVSSSSLLAAPAEFPENFVAHEPVKGGFPLVEGKQAAPIFCDPLDYPGVMRAAVDVQGDVERVTGIRPERVNSLPSNAKIAVLVGTLGKSAVIDALAKAGKINAAAITGKWESFLIATVDRPFPGVDRALVIAGSDKRGTIYGLYDISEKIGVSPWSWWADVPVSHYDALYIRSGFYVQGPPAVKYRGIFLNDEAPCLSGWSSEKFGGFNQKFYTRVFELLLRLRANYLWPAMWGSAFNEDDPANPRLADEYGIVMGTSHHEPMLRAQREWKKHGTGPWNYATNEAVLRDFWEKGVERNKNFESIVTIGMRGDGDEPMVEGGDMKANIGLLQRIITDQRSLIARQMNPDVTKVPQLWALYKEVAEYYEHGMRVPDDITLLWCDDNWGNVRHVPTPEERARSGGSGIYYHFDYVGGPRNYKWINTNPLPKIWEQLNLAYRYGIDRIWIVNVGDLKQMEMPIEFFLRMAWNPDTLPKEEIAAYTRRWAERDFGPEHASEIADLVSKYAKYTGWRKPELLAPDTFSLINNKEAERVSSAWSDLVAEADRIRELLPEAWRSAYFELVLYPIKAAATVTELYIAAGRNQLDASQGRASANAEAARVRELFQRDQELSDYYNTKLAGGKWSHMADQTHIGYTGWQEPKQNVMPEVKELLLPDTADFGVAVEGSSEAWPGSTREALLPPFDSINKQHSYFEIFAKGTKPIKYQYAADQPWIILSEGAAPGAGADRRIGVEIDWSKIPKVGVEARGSITITGDAAPITIKVRATKATPDQVSQARGCFGGLFGPIAVAAQDASRNIPTAEARWEKIPDYGRGLSGMEVFPVTAASILPPKAAPCLEYPLFIAKAGKIQVDAIIAPSLNIIPGRGLRLAVSFDNDPPQILDVFAKPDAPGHDSWAESVKDNVRVLSSTHPIATPGRHLLNITMVDPGVVLEKLVLHDDKLPESYFGPPEQILSQK